MSAPVWRSRITGEADVAPDQLMGHYANFRRHGGKQQDAMVAVLDDIGWVQRVLVSQRTGTVLDGHMRVELALRHHVPTVPVTYVDVTEEEERKILATFDPLGGLAYIDQDQLRDLLVETPFTDDALLTLHESIMADPVPQGDISHSSPRDRGAEAYDDDQTWVVLSIRLPVEVKADFLDGADSRGLHPHEYLEKLMEDQR